MEYLKLTEGRGSSPKREYRISRARNQRTMRSNVLESMAKIKSGGGVVSKTDDYDGVTRVKIVVKKQDLKQMLELIRCGKNNNVVAAQCSVSTGPSTLGLEHRLNLMRRRQQQQQQWRAANQVKGSRRSCWRPALHSIPEELQV